MARKQVWDNFGDWTPGQAPPEVTLETSIVEAYAVDPLWTGAGAQYWQNYQTRMIVKAPLLSGSGTRVRVKFKADPSTDTPITGASIGLRDSVDDFDGAPTRITFDEGSNGTTIPAGTSIWSDWIDFTIDDANEYLVHYACNGQPGFFWLYRWVGGVGEEPGDSYTDSSGSDLTMTQVVAFSPNTSVESWGVEAIQTEIGVPETNEVVAGAGLGSQEHEIEIAAGADLDTVFTSDALGITSTMDLLGKLRTNQLSDEQFKLAGRVGTVNGDIAYYKAAVWGYDVPDDAEDFSAYPLNDFPSAGWSGEWATIIETPGYATIKAEGTYGGKIMRVIDTGPSVNTNGYSNDAAGTPIGDCELLAYVAPSELPGHRCMLVISGTGAALAEYGYLLTLNAQQLRVGKVVNGSKSWHDSVGYAWAADTYYWMRFKREGYTLYGKVWYGGIDDEPDDWMVEWTDGDENVPDGWVGICQDCDGSASEYDSYDWFSWNETGEAPAPINARLVVTTVQGDLEFVIAELDYDWSANTWYWMRFRIVGDMCYAKIWEDGEDEPTEWMIEAPYEGAEEYRRSTGKGGYGAKGKGAQVHADWYSIGDNAPPPSPAQVGTNHGEYLLESKGVLGRGHIKRSDRFGEHVTE